MSNTTQYVVTWVHEKDGEPFRVILFFTTPDLDIARAAVEERYQYILDIYEENTVSELLWFDLQATCSVEKYNVCHSFRIVEMKNNEFRPAYIM